ncbi:MAG: hypothetical protein R3A51_13300 [Nannocystaceae bacterium]|nr:hypothetical protein [Myxococcales bacterium]
MSTESEKSGARERDSQAQQNGRWDPVDETRALVEKLSTIQRQSLDQLAETTSAVMKLGKQSVAAAADVAAGWGRVAAESARVIAESAPARWPFRS